MRSRKKEFASRVCRDGIRVGVEGGPLPDVDEGFSNRRPGKEYGWNIDFRTGKVVSSRLEIKGLGRGETSKGINGGG